jgi:hypothetical protein
MDEMLIHFSFVFDRWISTPTPPTKTMDGSVVTGCTAPAFPPYSRTCCTALVTQGLPHTMVARTVSSSMGTARSTWTFRLTPLTRLWWPGSPRLGATNSTTLERAAHQALTEFCERHLLILDGTTIARSQFGMRATRCRVSAWLPLVTPSFRPATQVGRSRHATPST